MVGIALAVFLKGLRLCQQGGIHQQALGDERGNRRVEFEHNGVIVRRFHRVNTGQVACTQCGNFRVNDAVDVVLHIRCHERRTIVPFYVLAKMERPFGGVLVGFPAFRQARNDVAIKVHVAKMVHHQACNAAGGHAGKVRRVKVGDFAVHVDDDGIVILLIRVPGRFFAARLRSSGFGVLSFVGGAARLAACGKAHRQRENQRDHRE